MEGISNNSCFGLKHFIVFEKVPFNLCSGLESISNGSRSLIDLMSGGKLTVGVDLAVVASRVGLQIHLNHHVDDDTNC